MVENWTSFRAHRIEHKSSKSDSINSSMIMSNLYYVLSNLLNYVIITSLLHIYFTIPQPLSPVTSTSTLYGVVLGIISIFVMIEGKKCSEISAHFANCLLINIF